MAATNYSLNALRKAHGTRIFICVQTNTDLRLEMISFSTEQNNNKNICTLHMDNFSIASSTPFLRAVCVAVRIAYYISKTEQMFFSSKLLPFVITFTRNVLSLPFTFFIYCYAVLPFSLIQVSRCD